MKKLYLIIVMSMFTVLFLVKPVFAWHPVEEPLNEPIPLLTILGGEQMEEAYGITYEFDTWLMYGWYWKINPNYVQSDYVIYNGVFDNDNENNPQNFTSIGAVALMSGIEPYFSPYNNYLITDYVNNYDGLNINPLMINNFVLNPLWVDGSDVYIVVFVDAQVGTAVQSFSYAYNFVENLAFWNVSYNTFIDYQLGYMQPDNYNQGYNDGYNYGYPLGYDSGFLDGYNDNESASVWGLALSAVLLPFTVFNFEIMPNFYIGYLLAIPLVFGLIAFLLSLGKRK